MVCSGIRFCFMKTSPGIIWRQSSHNAHASSFPARKIPKNGTKRWKFTIAETRALVPPGMRHEVHCVRGATIRHLFLLVDHRNPGVQRLFPENNVHLRDILGSV